MYLDPSKIIFNQPQVPKFSRDINIISKMKNFLYIFKVKKNQEIN